MLKMKKSKLTNIKVKSFVTSVTTQNSHSIKGGTSEDTTRHISEGRHPDCSHFCYGSVIKEPFL